MSNEDKNIDEIRALLRKKLEANAPAEDGWNVPSPGVWAGLSDELEANKKPQQKTANRWLLLAVAALAAMLLLRECSHRGQLGSLQLQMQQLEDSYEKLQRSCDEKTSSNQGQTRSEAAVPLAFGQAATPLSQSASPKLYFGEKGSKQYPWPAPFENASQSQIISIVSNSEVLTQTNKAEPEEVELPLPTPLAALPPALLSVENTAPTPNLYLPEGKKNNNSLPFIAHGYAGAALTGNRLAGDKPAIIARQKALLSWQAGVGLEAVLNRHWSLGAGLRYGTHRLQTDYALAVPFTHNGETMHDDGNFDNQYNHSLPSALGNYPLQLVLTRESAANVEEGEVMLLDLNIRQRIQQLSMPLNLRYGFGKHRWQMGVQAGLVANHTLAVEAEDHPALVSHHGAIHQRHTSVGNPSISDLQRFTFDTSLGLDLRYQLTHRLGLSFAGSWQRALTPVYAGAAVQSYLQSIGLNAGFHVWLR